MTKQEKMAEALKSAINALDTWLNTYAPEFCDEVHVEAAQKRIYEGGGTLAYIANTTKQCKDALK